MTEESKEQNVYASGLNILFQESTLNTMGRAMSVLDKINHKNEFAKQINRAALLDADKKTDKKLRILKRKIAEVNITNK